MTQFSQTSLERLRTCHPKLQALCNELIKYYDVAIICGFRGKADQDAAYEAGTSTKLWPSSKHNALPSLAVDLVPYPVDWRNTKRFYFMHGALLVLAKQMDISVRSGADWDSDFDFDEHKFIDLPHIELVEA